MSRDLESFERELTGAGDWRGAFKVALEGLTNNTFTRSLREIDETNLPTLKLRNPEAYATIDDRKIREALVLTDIFEVAQMRGPIAVENLEICWDRRYHAERILRALVGLAEACDSATQTRGPPYAGVEAVKVFIRALYAVIEEIGKSDSERFDVLHRIAHGRESRYGTPLDEIRICGRAVLRSLAKALRRIREDCP